MANVTKPIILDETGQAIVDKLGDIASAMTPPTAADIETSAITGQDTVEDALGYLDEKIDTQTEGVVKSVNAIHPDAQGEVKLTTVAYSDNFTSDKTQNSEGEFVIRTAGGDASISDGDAFVTRVYGNRVHTGYSPESLNMEVTMAPRVAPDPITAVLDEATFEAYVQEAGTYVLTYTTSWDNDPVDYGVTVTGTPLSGDKITIAWDGETEAYMTVDAPRVAPDGITATINRDTFVVYVADSGITTLTYTTMWSANPALYGVTVTGTPVNGDYITITYYKEQRGTISVATPTALKSTGWNLYKHSATYAYLTKYSTEYGFRIGGTYTALQYSATVDGEKSTITPVDGVFTIPADGYVWVTGGNSTNTYIINQWSDWTDGPAGAFEAYSETTIDLSTVMSTYFPNGLLRVGVVRDEININASLAISKIERKAYTAENLAAAKASGRAYEYDTSYIYIVKASYDSNTITLDGSYTASDHGNEFFTGTTVPVYLETMYGNNLKNKLERDVVTISQQTLTSAQQTQVRNNLSAASQADITTLNGSIQAIDSKYNDIWKPPLFNNATDMNAALWNVVSTQTSTNYCFEFNDPNKSNVFAQIGNITSGVVLIYEHNSVWQNNPSFIFYSGNNRVFKGTIAVSSSGVTMGGYIELMSDTMPVTELTCSVPIETYGSYGNVIKAYKFGRMVFVDFAINPKNALAAETVIATITLPRNLYREAHCAIITSSKELVRGRLKSNGEITVENSAPAQQFLAASFVAFI